MKGRVETVLNTRDLGGRITADRRCLSNNSSWMLPQPMAGLFATACRKALSYAAQAACGYVDANLAIIDWYLNMELDR